MVVSVPRVKSILKVLVSGGPILAEGRLKV